MRTFYDEEGQEDYQASLYREEDWVHNRLKDIVTDCARRLCSPCAAVLDAGCAEGLYLRELSGHIAHGVGLDLSRPKIRRAEQYASALPERGLHFLVASLEGLPFKDGHFDAVLSVETLEHVPDPMLALTEVYRVLRNDGAFVCSIPTELDEYGGRSKWNLSWREKSGHLHSFGREGFLALLVQTGFLVERMSSVDVLGGQIRRHVTNSTPWNLLRKLWKMYRAKFGEPAPMSPAVFCETPSAALCREHISLSWWPRLDALLSSIPLISRRASYCVYVAIKESQPGKQL
ncbi:MAG: class I SAM-dependent methyltransferase [Anaerolineae bacterium]|nr:class I SAM-dependent methyltransferase [Anaerolineae bacterium]